MTTLIGYVNIAIARLKSIVEATLTTNHNPRFGTRVLMRIPDRADKLPMVAIVPKNIDVTYADMKESIELPLVYIDIYLAMMTPFDDDGTQMLANLDELMEVLRVNRHIRTYWKHLSYKGGIEFNSLGTDKGIFQIAKISVEILVN